MNGAKLGRSSTRVSGHSRGRVQGADEIQQPHRCREVGVDRGVEVLDPVEPQEARFPRMAVGDP